MPAAGLSSRMRDWKPMLPFKDATIIDHSVRNALAGRCRVLLVAGYRGKELRSHFKGCAHVQVAMHHAYEKGMVSSIFEGMRYVETDHFFVAPADLPLIPPSVYCILASQASHHILFPEFGGRTGHPVLVPGSLLQELPKRSAAPNMKSILRQFPYKTIAVDSSGIYADIDSMEEYRRLLRVETIPGKISP